MEESKPFHPCNNYYTQYFNFHIEHQPFHRTKNSFGKMTLQVWLTVVPSVAVRSREDINYKPGFYNTIKVTNNGKRNQ
jgi:hypothetical protein